MERQHKIFLIVTGAVLLAAAIGIAIYQLTKSNDSDDDSSTDGASPKPKAPSKTNQNPDTPIIETNDPVNTPVVDPNMVTPRFNVENELSNPFSELKNQILYPKRTAMGGSGYANVRTEPEVNTQQAWWDPIDNLITTISSGTQIGRVQSEETKLYNGYNYRWFKVKLTKPTGGFFSPYTEGYVRADTVTFKQYRK